MKSLNKAIEINKELNHLIGIGNNFANLAGFFADIHEWDSADTYIDSAIMIYSNVGMMQEKYDAWIVKAKNYLEQQQFPRALLTYDQILTFIDSADANQSINLHQLYNGFYLVHKNLKNTADALYWHEKYVEARTELAESEKIAQVFETETRLGAKQMKRENAHLKSENELKQRVIYSQKIISIISVAFLFIFAIIIILLLQNRKKLQDANFNLEQKNQEIQKKTIELTHANATKDRFFSIIAHDLRNPFNALLGISDIIVTEARAKNDEEITDLAESLSETSKKTYDLLENLLEWSKSQRGILNMVPEDLNLNEEISRVLYSVGNNLKYKDITVHIDIDKSIRVRADERMLQVVLRNLIGNAIKFTNRRGKIEIDAHAQENFVRIVVSDNGIGMDAYTVTNLFKIEKTISTSGTENESGSGLGLILCEEFIKKQGGKIWAESELNKGSHFSFTLPKA
jgi:signal transduction histidine kinase